MCPSVLDEVPPPGDNNTAASPFGEGIELQQRPGTTFQLQGLAPSDCGGTACDGTVDTEVEEFLTDNNAGTANVRTSGRIVAYTDATCALPP